MRSRILLSVVFAAVCVLLVPTMAFGLLTNPYGQYFGGQNTAVTGCVECHDSIYANTLHSRHVRPGITPALPSAWTNLQSTGSATTVASGTAGDGKPWFTKGGIYPISGLTWVTIFDYDGDSRWSEEQGNLMFFSGVSPSSTVSPWNRISNLGLTHTGVSGTNTNVEYLQTQNGLSDSPVSSSCGMVNCHFTGGTMPLSSSQVGQTIPNPSVTTQPTTSTPTQWARDTAYSSADFNTSATVGMAGLSVQCEKCHGTGFRATDLTTRHFNSGTQLSHRLATQTVNGQPVSRTTRATLDRSDVCGVCHGLRSAPAVTGVPQYLMGYTPNLNTRAFVSVNATRGTNAPYTYTPTEAQFASSAAIYALYPNGNPKNGGHGGNQYWAWAASGHAVRVQYAATHSDPDQLPGAASTHFSLGGATTLPECLRCHSGEGYMTTKVPQITDGRTITSIWEGFTVDKTTSGFLGTECVVCHDPHPADSDIAASIRQPDPVGIRSNFGRTTANASMCEDCHNWQVETLANSLPLSDFNPQSLPGRVSHPQREMLHGVKRGTAPVMWEVPDMGEFMPGARCQNCHMPKTDTSAEYTSHGMHIQLPGDAMRWGATGQDSCTRCHEEAAPTLDGARQVLQDRIDEWQSEATAAAGVAKTALDAAKLRSEYVSGGAGARELYGRGWLNWNTFTNDGSNGVHNPPYVMAGLNAAKRLADSVGGTFGTIYATSRVTYGALAIIGANLKNGDGSNATSATVALEKLVAGVWTQQGDAVKSNDNGNASFLMMPAQIGTYRLRWDRCGNNVADIMSASRTITVVSVTTAVRSRSSVLLGRSLTISGSVSPNAAGQSVRIQAKKGSGSWRTLYTNTLSASSTYLRTVRPTSRGTWYYRVRYAGNSTIAGSYSPTVRVACK